MVYFTHVLIFKIYWFFFFSFIYIYFFVCLMYFFNCYLWFFIIRKHFGQLCYFKVLYVLCEDSGEESPLGPQCLGMYIVVVSLLIKLTVHLHQSCIWVLLSRNTTVCHCCLWYHNWESTAFWSVPQVSHTSRVTNSFYQRYWHNSDNLSWRNYLGRCGDYW